MKQAHPTETTTCLEEVPTFIEAYRQKNGHLREQYDILDLDIGLGQTYENLRPGESLPVIN